MNFVSSVFVLFFIIVFLVYWRLNHRSQNLFLLSASLFFYGFWDYRLLPLILLSATIDFAAGINIVGSRSAAAKRGFLVLSIVSNLGLLGFFKYADFCVTSFASMLMFFGFYPSLPTLEIILPVGISFYTFQSMSYTIDIYRGRLKPTRRYLDFLLYVSFFPQLVAGPIERAERLLPRILKPRRKLTTAFATHAIKLIIVGYFQKVAIADTLAPIAESTFSRFRDLDSVSILIGVYVFAIQIYCDFSGYSKIARGTAGLLGISLVKNFDQPYFSRSCRELWTRWHISLSSWLRDYVYIPLGGNRISEKRTRRNLILTMLLGGIWHGAGWNFVVWGAIHGSYLIGGRVRNKPKRPDLRLLHWRNLAKMVLMFHLVCFTWIFFRCHDLGDAADMIIKLIDFSAEIPGLELVYLLVYGTLVLVLDYHLEMTSRRRGYLVALFSRNWLLETVLLTAMLLLALLVGGGQNAPFIYFQF